VTLVRQFKNWLRELKSSWDKWISTAVVFIEMSQEFLEFINSYHIRDSIEIEIGYQEHTPRACLRQQEMLYRDNSYSRLHSIWYPCNYAGRYRVLLVHTPSCYLSLFGRSVSSRRRVEKTRK
jgi:hypothetical protein